jgi:peptidylprolyl isomerase
MIRAQIGDIVKVDLNAKLADGRVVVTSQGTEPIRFQVGAGEVIRGLDNAVIGMTEGESKTERIAPEDAFGRYSDKRLIVVNRGDLPSHIEPYKGQFLRVNKADRRAGVVRVALVDESRVILDTNHLLAGKEIILEIDLLEVASPAAPVPEMAVTISPGMSYATGEEIMDRP